MFKFQGAYTCNYCNVEVDNLLHIFADCSEYDNIRELYFVNKAIDLSIPNIFINELNCKSNEEVRNIVNLVSCILDIESNE